MQQEKRHDKQPIQGKQARHGSGNRATATAHQEGSCWHEDAIRIGGQAKHDNGKPSRPQERRYGQTDMQADRQCESQASTANHSQWDGPDIYIAMCVLMSRAHSAHNNIYIYVYIYIE